MERGLSFSIGWQCNVEVAEAIDQLGEHEWLPALNGDGKRRQGADVAEITDLLQLESWPAGTRVIVRREVPHPGAQLRLTDVKGRFYTAFATNTGGKPVRLEVRHRRRARVEDRIRCAKDTGFARLPPHGMAANAVWLQLVLLACDLLCWTETLALTGPMRAADGAGRSGGFPWVGWARESGHVAAPLHNDQMSSISCSSRCRPVVHGFRWRRFAELFGVAAGLGASFGDSFDRLARDRSSVSTG